MTRLEKAPSPHVPELEKNLLSTGGGRQVKVSGARDEIGENILVAGDMITIDAHIKKTQ